MLFSHQFSVLATVAINNVNPFYFVPMCPPKSYHSTAP